MLQINFLAILNQKFLDRLSSLRDLVNTLFTYQNSELFRCHPMVKKQLAIWHLFPPYHVDPTVLMSPNSNYLNYVPSLKTITLSFRSKIYLLLLECSQSTGRLTKALRIYIILYGILKLLWPYHVVLMQCYGLIYIK